MLPVSDNRNNDIRQLSRYGKVIEFITGTTQVSSCDVKASFDALWEQCTQLAVQESVSLGTVNQGAGTFYNTICAHKNLKAALLASTRIAVPIPAKETTAAPGHNGVFFDAVRTNTRVQQLPSAAPDAPTPAHITPSVPSDAAARDLPVCRAASTPSLISTLLTPQALIFPRFSIPTLWNAWWHASETFEFPMRRLNEVRLLTKYTAKHSENVSFCRFKKVISLIQSNMSDAMCEVATERCFVTGWSKLSAYVMQNHGIILLDSVAPSTLYEYCNKLGDAFRPPKWSAYD
jgi:hypothetical protein